MDFTRFLGSSSEEIVESNDELVAKNTNTNDNNPRKVYNRLVSIQSIESSTSERQFYETQVEPVEVMETRTSGNVSHSVYASYYSAGGNTFKLIFFIFMCIITQIFASVGDFWMTYW